MSPAVGIGAVGLPLPVPAPFGGMNTRDGVATLQPQEARYLENWDPDGNAVRPRAGFMEFSSGAGSATVATLAAYHGLTASKLIGVAGGSVYDFSAGTASLLSAAGYANSRFQTEIYNNRLIAVNGADTPFSFDGSTVAATGFTGSGLTLSRLVNVAKVRNRLWFCEKESADAWYGGIGAITGALTKFQLSQVVGGGTLMAVGAHSQDAGAGPDDYTAFVMSTGEVVLYAGDPSTDLTKVGNFLMPPPVGRQCLTNIGGQLAVVTRMGLVPLSAAVSGLAFDVLALGNFGKVAPSIQRDVERYGALAGWQALFHDGRVIINVPTLDDAGSRQWVYNTLTGAWTQWTGMNPASLAVYDGALVFGAFGEGTVHQRRGTTDLGEAISLRARAAFVTAGEGRQLRATAIRFDMAVDGSLSGRFGLDADYIARPITIPNVALAASYTTTPWGSPWGSAWGTSNQYKGAWFSTYGQGRSLGLALEASGLVTDLEWYGTQILTQPAGVL